MRFDSMLAVLVLVGVVSAEEAEIRPPDFYRDRVIVGMRPRDPQERDKAQQQTPHVTDQDLNNIAILVDDGTLVVAGITDTDAIAARFYASHADVFDFICIFVASSFPLDVNPEGGFAFEQNIRNDTSGIGLNLFNFGSSVAPGITNLKSILNMNDLGEYGRRPNEPLPGFVNADGGIDILGQEACHMVGAFVTADNADILGRGNSHWSFFFQSYGSVLEGNRWQNAGGTSWTTIESSKRFSQLDNYLWGFLLDTQVTEPMFLLANPDPTLLLTQAGDSSLPVPGVTVTATGTIPVTMQNILANNGTRNPTAATSQKAFTMAWILVIPEGTTVLPEDLEKIDDFRTEWEEDFFPRETGGLGSMSSELAPTPVSADFEARVFAGEVGLVVQFDNDSFGSISGFQWDFGDGKTSTVRHPLHVYEQEGLYDVKLTVYGVGGPVERMRSDYVHVGLLTEHWSDDFETPTGWARGDAESATTGNWLRTDPVGSQMSTLFGNDVLSAVVQPENDHTISGTHCLVTGNTTVGQAVGVNDVDGGRTEITSPLIDLSAATDPILSWWSWFSNNAGSEPGRDELEVHVSADNGATWSLVRKDRSSHHRWEEDQVRLAAHIAMTDSVRIRVRASDLASGSIVEALVDDIRIFDVETSVEPTVTGFVLGFNQPNPFVGKTVIPYAVPAPGSNVAIRLFSVDGRLVRTLVNRQVEPGIHSVSWDGRNHKGLRVATGVYLVQMRTSGGDLTRKVFFVR